MKKNLIKKDYIAALDVGTTKVCCLIAEVIEQDIQIVGIGKTYCNGLRKGVVINIEETIDSILRAVSAAQAEAGIEVTHVLVGIAGGHIKSFNSTGIVAVKEMEISQTDVQRVLEAATAVAIPMDRETIHIIPQGYAINDQGGIHDPVGMSGVRLEAKVHVVTGAIASAQNLIKCVNKAGLRVIEMVLEPIASSEAVLCYDEKELGVVLIDIGGGTTDIAIFKEGCIVYTAVLAIGGAHITNDIAVGLTTPQSEAERIKIEHGCTLQNILHSEEVIEVPGVGGRKSKHISKRTLGSIIEPRLEEMLFLIKKEIVKSGYEGLLSAGVVMTGGSTLLTGFCEYAENILHLPVKRGIPQVLKGVNENILSPQYSTAVGLLKYGQKNLDKVKFSIRDKNIYRKFQESMQSWIRNLF